MTSLAQGTGKKWARRWLAAILLAYLAITVAYGVVNPLFEAPDEQWHFFTAEYIAATGRLPSVTAEPDEWLSQEAAQPPLYYVLGAALIAPVDTSASRQEVWPNKFGFSGDARFLTNSNLFIHGPREAFPWSGYALAAHLLRLGSTLLGLGTLIFLFSSARLIWPGDRGKALLATAVVAFLPQFNFVHASISNDSLIIFLTSAALWQLLRLWLNRVSRTRLLLLGLTLGLAALTKNAGVLLLVYSLFVLVLLGWRDGRPQTWLETAGLVLLPALLLAGWLWIRNQGLYQDWTATEPFIRLAGGDRQYSLLQVLGESPGLWWSSQAVFGWFNIRAPYWVYAFWTGLVLLALAGAGRGLWLVRARWRRPASLVGWLIRPSFVGALLALWVLLVYAGLLLFMLRTPAAQGRLIFPALLPLGLGLAYGLTAWESVLAPDAASGRGLGSNAVKRWRWIWPAGALITTLYCLLFVIRPAYALPPIVAALPTGVEPGENEMGQGLVLLGAQVETDQARPGDPLWLTLYWRADAVPVESPERVVEVFGRELTRIGNEHSYHSRGLFPADLWPAGEIVVDRLGLYIEEEMAAPVLARVFVRLVGDREGIEVGQVKIISEEATESAGRPMAQLGERITLTQVTLQHCPAVETCAMVETGALVTAHGGDRVVVKLQWQVEEAPGQDLTTLLHLGPFGVPPLATGDSPPLAGDYPTRVWAKGEVIDDSYELLLPPDLAPGEYPMWVGMYDPQTLTRLSLSVEGVPAAGDIWPIGTVVVPSDP